MSMDLHPRLSPRLQRLLAFIGDTADGAFVVSLDCQFLAWSTRATSLFGFAPSDILGRYCYDALPARDESGRSLCCVNCPMVTEARFGRCVPPADVQIWGQGDRRIWVRMSPILLRNLHGMTCAILVLATNVDRYKQAEQAARLISRRVNGDGVPETIVAGDGAALLRRAFPDLSAREADVLWEAVMGEEYRQIAQVLGISGATVRNHLQRVLEKLGVHSTRQAALRALLAIVSPEGRGPAGIGPGLTAAARWPGSV